MVWLNLMEPNKGWRAMKTLGAHTNFSNYHWRDSTVVKNKIVYFGSSNENATYRMEQEDQSRDLAVTSKFGGIDYQRGDRNSSFCTNLGKIYYFPTKKNKEVWCLDAETEKASLFFSQNDH